MNQGWQQHSCPLQPHIGIRGRTYRLGYQHTKNHPIVDLNGANSELMNEQMMLVSYQYIIDGVRGAGITVTGP